MAVAASGSQVKWFYGVEDSSGVIQPNETTPAWTPIRFNTSDLARDTAQIDSDEINQNRQREKSRQGTFSVAGSLVANLSFGSHDTLLAAAFQASWVTQLSYAATTIAAIAATNEFTDSANQFIVEGFAVGDLVTISGFTGGFVAGGVDFKITSVSAGSMIIGGTDGDAIIDDASGESVTIATAGDTLDVGETVPRFSLLRRNTDTNVNILYRGCRISDLSFAVALNVSAIITLAVVGENVENYTYPGGSTVAAATTTEMMVPTIGYMQDNETALNYLTDYNVDFTNDMNPLFSLFQRPAYAVSNGVFTANGSLAAYQPDSTLLDKFLDETETDHIVKLVDLAGNYYRIILPDVLYTQLADPVSGPAEHLHTYTFTAGYDDVTTARLERSV